MKSFIVCCIFSLLLLNVYSQTAIAPDSLPKRVKDSLRREALWANATYPLIINSKMSGVFPVTDIKEKPDVSMKYKLLMNLTQWAKDSVSIKKVSAGLAEIGRIINLHVAAGIPKENLDIVIVVHAGALNAFLTDPEYKSKFKTDNPSLDIIKQFAVLNAKFIACGQAEIFLDIPKEKMIPEIKTALTAIVTLSTYQLKGYVLYNINNDEK